MYMKDGRGRGVVSEGEIRGERRRETYEGESPNVVLADMVDTAHATRVVRYTLPKSYRSSQSFVRKRRSYVSD